MLHKSMPMKTIELILSDRLQDCDIWSDLGLSEEEFDILTQKIRAYIFRTDVFKTYLSLFQTYPICAVSQIVYFVVYQYQDEFWTPWAKNIGLDIDQSKCGYIGSKVISVFKKYNMKYSEDGYKYVTPIMCQAGIPYAHMDDLFDAVYSERRVNIDAQALVADLLNWKSHVLHKSVIRFLADYPSKAAEMLADANELLQTQSSGAATEGNNAILLKKYDEWRKTSKETQRLKRRSQEYPLPVMSFSDDGRGICLRLPSITAKNEYTSAYRWVLCTRELTWKKEVVTKLYRESSRLYTKEQWISAPPAEAYIVQLFDDIEKNALLEREITGFANDKFALFDSHGRKINDEFIPPKQAYLVYQKEACIVKTAECNKMDIWLPENCAGWEALMVAPENPNATIKIEQGGKKNHLRIRSVIHSELSHESYLFGQRPYRGNMPLYVKLPKLSLWMDEGFYANDLSVQIRHRQTGEVKTIALRSPFSGNETVDFSAFFPKNQHGVFAVRIYERKYLRKNFLLAYVPEVVYTTYNLLPWPVNHSNGHKTGFEYQQCDDVTIELAENVNSQPKQKNWISVLQEHPITEIRGTISFDTASGEVTLPWVKCVRNFTWSVWEEQNLQPSNCYDPYALTDADLQSDRYWLSFWVNEELLDSKPELVLTGRDGAEKQIVSANVNNGGRCTIPFDVFAATIQENVLPISVFVRFCASGVEHRVLLARVKEKIVLPGIGYVTDSKSGSKYLWWNMAGKNPDTDILVKGITEPDFSEVISMDKLMANKARNKWMKQVHFAMRPGVYKLEQSVEEDFFGEIGGYRPPKLQRENIFEVAPKQMLKEAQTSITGFMKFCLYQVRAIDSLKSLVEFLHKNYAGLTNDISEETCKIVCCIIVNYAEETDPVSTTMMEIVEAFNKYFLTNDMRTAFMKWIIGYDLNSTQRRNCFRLLNLYLAGFHSGIRFTAADIEEIQHINQELGLLWMLRTNSVQGLYNKLDSVVGLDAIKTMVKTPVEVPWSAALRRVIDGKYKNIEVELSRNLLGKTSQFHEMFEWGAGHELPHIILRKRPENGIYFCGQTFCDILINWYLVKRRRGLFETDYKDLFIDAYLEMDRLVKWINGSHLGAAKALVRTAESRRIDTRKDGFYPLFYYSAIASMIHTLQYHGIKISACEKTEAFLVEMMQIFPELIKRDLLMCELLTFFEGRK